MFIHVRFVNMCCSPKEIVAPPHLYGSLGTVKLTPIWNNHCQVIIFSPASAKRFAETSYFVLFWIAELVVVYFLRKAKWYVSSEIKVRRWLFYATPFLNLLLLNEQ